jgi:hypothetical protein
MIDLRAAARANPNLRHTPLVKFTGYEPVSAVCDFANVHLYPKGAEQPERTFATAHDRIVGPAGVMRGKPIMVTEFGYHTLAGAPRRRGDWEGVDHDLQAVLIINGLLDAAALGVRRTYIYQLLDGYADPGPAGAMQKHFGLFEFDGSPKPAAWALRTLFSVLADNAPQARHFTPARLQGQFAVAPPVSRLALRDSAGRAFLALWNESPIRDPLTAAAREVPPAVATVRLARAAPMKTFDVVDAKGDVDHGVTSAVAVAVGAHPVILRIG